MVLIAPGLCQNVTVYFGRSIMGIQQEEAGDRRTDGIVATIQKKEGNA